MLDVQVILLYSMSVFEGKYGRRGRISFLRVVFVCVEGIDFDGRMVILESKWWFSSGSEVGNIVSGQIRILDIVEPLELLI